LAQIHTYEKEITLDKTTLVVYMYTPVLFVCVGRERYQNVD